MAGKCLLKYGLVSSLHTVIVNVPNILALLTLTSKVPLLSQLLIPALCTFQCVHITDECRAAQFTNRNIFCSSYYQVSSKKSDGTIGYTGVVKH